MILLTKQIKIKTVKDLTDFLYIASMAIVAILSLAYTLLIITKLGGFFGSGPILSGNPLIFILVALVTCVSFYLSLKTQVLRLQAAIALLYTISLVCILVIFPAQLRGDFNFNMYSLYPGLPDGLLVWVSFFFIWLHVFYRNKYNYFTKS